MEPTPCCTPLPAPTLAGCRHCLDCRKVEWRGGRDADSPQNAGLQWWPGGLESPTVYYMLRERQLAYQFRAAAFQSARCWRQQSVAAEADSELLRRRGRPQLPPVRLPLTAAGVGIREAAVCVGSFSVICSGPEAEPSSKRSRLSAVDQQLEQRRRQQLAAAVVAAAVEEALHLVAPHAPMQPLPATPPLAASLSRAPAHAPRLAGPPGSPAASWLQRAGSLLSPTPALRSVVVR